MFLSFPRSRSCLDKEEEEEEEEEEKRHSSLPRHASNAAKGRRVTCRYRNRILGTEINSAAVVAALTRNQENHRRGRRFFLSLSSFRSEAIPLYLGSRRSTLVPFSRVRRQRTCTVYTCILSFRGSWPRLLDERRPFALHVQVLILVYHEYRSLTVGRLSLQIRR